MDPRLRDMLPFGPKLSSGRCRVPPQTPRRTAHPPLAAPSLTTNTAAAFATTENAHTIPAPNTATSPTAADVEQLDSLLAAISRPTSRRRGRQASTMPLPPPTAAHDASSSSVPPLGSMLQLGDESIDVNFTTTHAEDLVVLLAALRRPAKRRVEAARPESRGVLRQPIAETTLHDSQIMHPTPRSPPARPPLYTTGTASGFAVHGNVPCPSLLGTHAHFRPPAEYLDMSDAADGAEV